MNTLPPLPDGFELPALPDGFQLEGASASAAPPEEENKKAARAWLEQHPAYQKQGLMDYARMAANGATFGFADNAVAGAAALRDYMTHGGSIGDYYDKEKALQDLYTENARKNTGAVGTGLEFAGSVVPTMGVGGLASKAIASPFKASVATGATAGALQSAGDDQNPLLGAGMGAIGGGVGHGVVSGVSKLAGLANTPKISPTLEELKRTGDTARDAFTSSPDRYTQADMRALRDYLRTTLEAEGFNAASHPGLTKGLGELDRLASGRAAPFMGPPPADITPYDLYMAERLVRGAGKSSNAEEARLAGIAQQRIGHWMGSRSPGARVALENSNKAYSTYYKDKAVQDALEKAEVRAGVTGSGGNRENTMRQEIKKVAESRKDWSPDVKEAFKQVELGAPGQNLVRLLGKASPEGNGLSLLLHLLGGPLTGGMNLPIMAAGIVAKRASEGMTRGHVADLSKIIRAGGQRSNAFAADNKVQRGLKNARPTIAGLLGTGGELY